MATVTVTDLDLQRADAFLTAYLTAKVPDADFGKGSVLRDFCVKSIAFIFVFLEQERRKINDQRSLLRLSQLPPSVEVDQAVDEYLSNIFLPRKTGTFTRLPVLLHFAQATDFTVKPSHRFFRDSSTLFLPDITEAVFVPAEDLRPVRGDDGSIVDYVYNLTLVAAKVGTAFNVPPGRFSSVDAFSPFFSYAENVTEGKDGKDIESTADLLKRAPTAMSTRNAINERSVNAILFEKFPTLERLLAVGMGDPEMLRDETTEFGARLRLHLGGCTDVYVGLPRAEATEVALLIGGSYARADNKALVLRDPSVVDPFQGVLPGMVLKISEGFINTPREYVIARVAPNEIEIDDRVPFPFPTDESGRTVAYSIGTLTPFVNIVNTRAAGVTSRAERTPNCVALQGRPVYRVKKVEVVGTEPGASVVLTKQTNGVPAIDEFKVEVLNPRFGQSSLAVTRIQLHPSHTGVVNVTYDTLVGYQALQDFITGRFDRVINANHLVRGYNPAYVKLDITYSRKNGAKNAYTADELRAAVATYVNGFDWTDVIDVTSIGTAIKNEFPDIGVVYPFVLEYSLYAPDGQVYTFRSNDIATVFPADTNLAELVSGGTAALEELGVSDRNVRYLADLADITVTER